MTANPTFLKEHYRYDNSILMRRPDRSILCFLIVTLIVGVTSRPGHAQSPTTAIESKETYKLATSAMRDGLFSVAANNFRATLDDPTLASDQRAALEKLYVESLVRSGSSAAAMKFIQELPAQLPSEMNFWQGVAAIRLGRLADAATALKSYQESGDKTYQLAAALARADVLLALREPVTAAETLEIVSKQQVSKDDRVWLVLKQAEIATEIGDFEAAESYLTTLPSDKIQVQADVARDYVTARLHLGQGRYDQAAVTFQSLTVDDREVPEVIATASRIGTAKAQLLAGQPEQAVRALKDWLTQTPSPSSDDVRQVFQLLDGAGLFVDASITAIHAADIQQWTRDTRPLVAAEATYHVVRAQLAKDPVLAWDTLEDFAQWYGFQKPIPVPISLIRGETMLRLGQFNAASDLLAALSSAKLSAEEEVRRAFLLGQAATMSGDFDAAQKAFASAALRATPQTAAVSNYNAALAAMQNGLGSGFEPFRSALEETGRGELAARLLLERGIYLSGEDPELARVAIWQYIRSFPNRAESSRAYIILAEIALRNDPPAPEKARNQLSKVTSANALPSDLEKRDYLMIWVSDLDGEFPEAISLANEFITKWPNSPYIDEVRMKLGETYFNTGDYVNARAQFVELADSSASPVFQERARFFAGRAASLSLSESSLDDALELFQKVVDNGGSLVVDARREQAILLVRQAKIDAAVDLLDSVLADRDSLQKREFLGVLLQKGEILLANRPGDEAAVAEARDAFHTLVEESSAEKSTAYKEIRAKGIYSLGRLAEASGHQDEALDYYYQILESDTTAENGTGVVFWQFRSGMSAIDLLTRSKNWEAAATLATKVSKLPHPRAEEAKALAEKIRLNHFIWPEK